MATMVSTTTTRPARKAGRMAVMVSGSRLGIRCRSSSDGVGAGLKTCHGGAHLSAATKAELERVAALIATPGKGITACDEGPGTIGGRFEAVGLQNSEEARRSYRQMLFETEGSADYLCGAILDPETLYQRSSTDGALFPEKLSALGVVPGVKPHLKIYELPGQGGATVMQGLDSLAARCQEYAAAGAKFAKWRSPLAIDVAAGQPSSLTIQANMDDLARYALICQDNGLMPIVEPDISLKGCHDLETAVMVNVQVQSALYKSMLDHGVFMEGATLKPNIVNPGLDCEKAYTVEEIAKANIDVLNRCFPCSMKGANFLSGGQSLADASARLSAMNQAKGTSPWNLSFSWSAALQLPLLELARETKTLCLEEMSALYLEELKIAGAAARGEYVPKGNEGAHVPKQKVVANA
ncbi:fructose-1,6-bisphosphate aldolase [Chloropicon roscoffensis]|uniref:fructose-bisphosphate aldolase n=2 Tax=Chloropicon roscoffensis TaxID=1461544 RepID=A0AAX4P5S8_9CHLO